MGVRSFSGICVCVSFSSGIFSSDATVSVFSVFTLFSTAVFSGLSALSALFAFSCFEDLPAFSAFSTFSTFSAFSGLSALSVFSGLSALAAALTVFFSAFSFVFSVFFLVFLPPLMTSSTYSSSDFLTLASMTALLAPSPRKPLVSCSMTLNSILSLVVPSWMDASKMASSTVLPLTLINDSIFPFLILSYTLERPGYFLECVSLYSLTIMAFDAREPLFGFPFVCAPVSVLSFTFPASLFS